jgi:iron-sulfur cluster assembly protein
LGKDYPAADPAVRLIFEIERTIMPITLSETAAREIKTIIQQQSLPADSTKLRVGVKGGGCSGFSYMLDLTEEPKTEADEQMESGGIQILCDMKSYLYLNGTEIDFKDEVMGRGFVFKNPNATSTCGCGSSFTA